MSKSDPTSYEPKVNDRVCIKPPSSVAGCYGDVKAVAPGGPNDLRVLVQVEDGTPCTAWTMRPTELDLVKTAPTPVVEATRVIALVARVVALWDHGQPHSDGDAAMRLVHDIMTPDVDLDAVERALAEQEE